MSTVAATFTDVGVSVSLALGNQPEEVTYTISNTFAATWRLERALTPDGSAWETLVTSTGTASGKVQGKANDRFRVNCTDYTSGTITYSISDGDAIVQQWRDYDGNVLVTLLQSGLLQLSSASLGGTTVSTTGLNETALCLDIADGSADAAYYLVSPYAGTVSKIWTVIDDVVSTADITITPRIGVTEMTDGLVTIATAASAAGDVDSSTPSALNVVTAGQAINFAVQGGGSGGAPRIHLIAILSH